MRQSLQGKRFTLNNIKRKIRNLIEDSLGIKVFQAQFLPRGTDLFHDINRCYGIHNFRVVFDVGANIGQSAIRYARAFPSAKIYSFEPVQSTFEELKRNTEKISDRVRLIQAGMGSIRGTKEINLNDDSKVNSILHNVTANKEEIRVETIDCFMKRTGIDILDFLKIDTEGYELEVLTGAREALAEQRIGMLFIESEPKETNKHFIPFDDLQKFMDSFDYHLFGIYEQQVHWSGEHHILFFNPVFICQKFTEKGVNHNTYPLCHQA